MLPVSDLHSRSGPVVVEGVEVFRNPLLGKYACLSHISSPDSSPLSSAAQRPDSSSPERTVYGILEALSSPVSVELTHQRHNAAQQEILLNSSSHHSRSGPDIGDREMGFQHPPPGKYHDIRSSSLPHSTLPCRQPRSGNLLLYYQNVGGMNTTIAEYHLASSDESYDIIVLTETWLSEHTLSRHIFGDCYEVFRTDRSTLNSSKSSGGGVLIAVHRRLKAQVVENSAWSKVEQVWVQIKLAGYSLYLCAIYLPPDRTRDLPLIETHTESLHAICTQALPVDEFVVFGDFNFPSVKWRPCSDGFLFADPLQSTFHEGMHNLFDNYNNSLLRQINSVNNENGRMLDLCFVSNPDYAPRLTASPQPLVKTVNHHPALHLTLEVSHVECLSNTSDIVSYAFNRTDFSGMLNLLLDINWNDVLDNDDINVAVQIFSNILNYAIDRHVPKRITPSVRHVPWQTTELRRLKTSKRAALRRFSKYGGLALRNHYMRINIQYKRMSQQCYANYLRDIQTRLKSDPKSFWKHVNEQRKEFGLPSKMKYGNQTGTSAEEYCKLFSEKFSSVFSLETLTSDQIALAANNVPIAGLSLNRISVSDAMIKTALSEMKPSTSVGPDGIPAILLKKCSEGMLAPLRHIFNLSLSTGIFPSLWKKAFMFPVHKKGNKNDIDNYRGIAALCATSKLFEKVVLGPIFEYCKHLIDDTQHGFMPRRSTTTNLLSFTTYVTDAMSSGYQTDTIYTDLSTAFDKINHEIAVAKLDRMGLGGTLLLWLKSYLVDRHSFVKIGESMSNEFISTSGIPQGSHLGPLIFLLYFNDVNALMQGPKLSFADDLKIFFVVKSVEDALFLQHQLENFARWCDVNRMVLNIEKCSIVSFTRKKQPILYNYHLAGELIHRVTCVKDLGVLLDSQLTYKQHINYIVAKASRSFGLIMRMTRNFTDVYCLKNLYCSLVRPTLEYCSVIWNPHYLNGVNRIEAVQRRFIRYTLRRLPWNDPYRLPCYESRLMLIGLDTLSTRRNLCRATLVADIIMARTDCPMLLNNINLRVQYRAVRYRMFLHLPFRRTNYGANGAIIGIQRVFNQVSSGFDFHLSRDVIRRNFLDILRNN